MLTREEILTNEYYCAEHKMSHKSRLAELQIPFWDFYKAKKKYMEEDSSVEGPDEFVQLSSGRYIPGKMPAARTTGRAGKQEKHTFMAKSAMESPYVRRMKMLSKSV